MQSVGSPWLWIGFVAFVVAMLALDLGVFHRRAHVVRAKEALVWTLVWVGLALAFNAGIYFRFGPDRALEFLTGYLIEKALSVDNLFVFLVLFAHFGVPAQVQHRVLIWGIIGALVMRAAFILAGGALLHSFHWLIYLFGAFLVLTGIKLLVHGDARPDPERGPALRLFRRFVPSVQGYRGASFAVREGGRWRATTLLAVLVVIEATDLMFALDSIPAIFAITGDPFIVFTSNIFAILGLRALYFLIAGALGRFRFLRVGLALVLAFVGAKMLLSGTVEVPIAVSLGVISGLLAFSVGASLLLPGPPRMGEVPEQVGPES